jgi:hypothetical protein
VVDFAGKQMQFKLADEFHVNSALFSRGPLELILGEGTVHFARQLTNGHNGNGNGYGRA